MSFLKSLFNAPKDQPIEQIVIQAIYDNDIQAIKNCLNKFDTERLKVNNSLEELAAIHIAASEGRNEIVKLLLTEPISESPNLSRANNFYPIHAAAMNGHIRTVQTLIENGAYIDVQTEPQLYTPLHSASFGGHLEIVKLLVEQGAKIDLKNYRDELPIDTAKRQNQTEVVAYLKRA